MLNILFTLLLLISSAHASTAHLETRFRALDFLPIQERVKTGLDGLNDQELFAVAQLLLSAASKSNEDLGFKLLQSISSEAVPCIQYYRAEWFLRKGRNKEAQEAIGAFLKGKPQACDNTHRDLYSCCPQSKFRNALGLKKLAEANPSGQIDVELKLNVPEAAKQKKVPLIRWSGMTFLVDTGSEHHVWNTQCEKELQLEKDSSATYGGSDSVGSTVTAVYARPKNTILGLKKTAFQSGFAMDLSSTSKEYPQSEKFCGIISPQRLIPKGQMIFDWSAGAILFCQGEKCRKSLDMPANCPLYQFNGRPYVNVAINEEGPRLFLLDTGAQATSANKNYFRGPIVAQAVEGEVTGVKGRAKLEALESAKVSFCGAGFRAKPFSVRPASENWEWSENGKVGMDILFDSLIMLDFGKGTVLVK